MSGTARRGLLPLALLLAGALAGPPAPRAPAPAPGPTAYRRALDAVAWVRPASGGQGTGWVVDRRRRWLITCQHVVGEGDAVEAVFPLRENGAVVGARQHYLTHLPRLRARGLAVQGKVVRRSPESDLVLVELASLPPGVGELPLAAGAGPGERAHAIGNRFDLSVLWTYATGHVRVVRRLPEGYFTAGRRLAKGATVVVASVPINEGDSGGPLLNDRGEVIGVSAAVAWELDGAGLFIEAGAVRALLAGPGRPAPVPAPPAPLARDLYRQGLRSTALVQYRGGSRSAGVLIDRRRRLLLTTADAVAREKTVEVAFPVWQRGRPVAEVELLRKKRALVIGVVLATDPRRNLALVEAEAVPKGAVAAALANGEAAPGDRLHLITNPARLKALWAYAPAWVRQAEQVRLSPTPEGPTAPVLVVQAPLVDGERGGPALDESGALAGLTTGKIGPQQQLAYVLPASEIRAFLAEARPGARPRGPAELVARALLFLDADRARRARADLDEAVRLGPRHAPAWAERGRARRLEGDLDGALADCDRALRLAPGLVSAHVYRAAAWNEKGRPAQAVADCDAALKLDGKSAAAFAERARARLALGDAGRALADADEAVWLDRELPEAYLARGAARAAGGDHLRAVDDFTQALSLRPRLPEALRRRGDAYWARSNVPAALADYEKALELSPNDDLARLGRGRARLAQGQVTEGAADLAEAVRRRRELLGPALAELERRADELAGEPAAQAELCAKGLGALGPLLDHRPELAKQIADGLAAAQREADVKKRARALRALLARARPRAR
jgi:tetratricopeptide (TPR) repeat protein